VGTYDDFEMKLISSDQRNLVSNTERHFC